MIYGLDLTDCRFVTDERGQRLRADIPYSLFAMLAEFRSAALRAQTERIDRQVSPSRASRQSLYSTQANPLHIDMALGVPVYPLAVLGYIGEGKTPLTAWRLYRQLSIAQVATAYGTSVSNMKTIASSHMLREGTRKKLATIFDCEPSHLLQPEVFDLVAPARRISE